MSSSAVDPKAPKVLLPTQNDLINFDPRWQELKETFGKATLFDVAVGLNQSCLAWDDGDVTPARLGGPHSALSAMEAKSPSWRWAASECLRQALMWSSSVDFDNRVLHRQTSVEEVCKLVHRATAAQLETSPSNEAVLQSSGAWDFIYPIWAPQYLMSRSSSLRLGQALWMFRDAVRSRKTRDSDFPAQQLSDSFTAALGMPVEQFVLLVLLIYGHSASLKPGLRASLWTTQDNAETFGLIAREPNGLFSSRVASALSLLSANRTEMRAWMAEFSGVTALDDLGTLRAPNPLVRFPLLRPFDSERDFSIAPIPAAILEWLYEPLVHHLFENLPNELRKPYALLFEEYVGMVLNNHHPSDQTQWTHESEMLPTNGSKVVDWARVFPNSIVMVDAKRCFISLEHRYRIEVNDWSSTEKALREGVVQGAAFWRSLRSGLVPKFPGSGGKRPILVLVTQGDTSVIGQQERIQSELAELAKQECGELALVVLSLDQLQHVAVNWTERGDDWLEALLLRVAEHGRGILPEEAPHRCEGPLWNATLEFLNVPHAPASVHSLVRKMRR